jgi:hypothetical protein
MPHFSIEAEDQIERNGISKDDALADLAAAREMPGVPSGKLILVGHLAMYECQMRRVFGQVDIVVIRVFVRHG